jgi:CheY-like chemotaxis protein/nitrogen-specific signal transduction histidine kinase
MLHFILMSIFSLFFFLRFIHLYDFRTAQLAKIISYEKQLEAQKKIITVKDTFLSNMSHELRTPLNGIYGALQIVEGNDETEKAVLKAAKSSAEALNRIVSDILDIQKLSNGKLQISPQWNVSAPLLNQVQNLFTPLANIKKIALDVNNDSSVPLELYCDEVRLGQILNNIIGNAIKFTEHGAVTLNAHYEDNHLIIEVSDTGIGMDEVALSNLFERFTQADSSINKKYAGTGLGMAITKDLVELMNGTIEVTSELGKGTTFTVKIPLEGRGTTLVEQPKSSPIQNKKTEDIRILLIDDDSTNRLIGKTMLEKRYQHVDTAEDGAEALAKINSSTYDIIITDIQMPVMNGEELLEKLKMTHPHLPVIALTGNAYEHETEQYLANGFVAVETKPFDTASLLRTIENTLS